MIIISSSLANLLLFLVFSYETKKNVLKTNKKRTQSSHRSLLEVIDLLLLTNICLKLVLSSLLIKENEWNW